MIVYLFRRIGQAIPLLLGLIVLVFLLTRLAPGDPANYLLGDAGGTPEQVAAIRERLGLDRPFIEQLGAYVGGVLTGDFGTSFFFDRPVFELLISRMPATALLAGSQLLLAIALGVPLGVYAAYRRGTALDSSISFMAVFGYSLPVFWSGQILILLFAVVLGILPAQGITSTRESHEGLALAFDVLLHLALPALTLALVHMALIARLMRASMADVLTRDFIITARSKGLRERTVLWRHAVRNSLLPLVTVIGLEIGSILAGTVVTETVFGWPGIGRLMFESIARRDYPVIMGAFILAAVGVIVANLVTDLVYGSLDPRIRVGERRG